MKGSFYGLKGKHLSLITIVLMCTAILIWGWEKTPLLTNLVPPQTLLELDPETYDDSVDNSVEFVPSEPEIHVDRGVATFAQRDTVKEESYVAAQLGSEQSSQKSNEISSDLVTTHVKESGIFLNGAKDKQVQEADRDGNAECSTCSTKADGKDVEIVEEKGSNQEEQTAVDTRHKEKAEEKNSDLQNQNVDLVTPIGSTYTNTSVDKLTTPTQTPAPVCNYAKGKWVVDNKKPLYSGHGCKQWLSGMWACQLTQRTDFAYEKLSWQPKDCQMEEFEGSKFLKRMQDKTLAFVGDSLGRQQFQSLMCMITGGKERHDVMDVGMEYGIAQARGDARPSGWAYRFPSTNTTILYYWSSTLCDVEPINVTNPATDYAMHLDRPPAFLRHYIHKFDVLVLNTGHHWNRGKLKANRWVMHVGGVPNTNKKIAVIWRAKNVTVHSVVNWVNSQLPKYPGLKAFYRTLSPRHFVGGDWNTGGSCDNTTPMSIGKEVLQDVSNDSDAAGAVQGTRVKLLDITALSQVRDEGHISRFSITAKSGVQDCLHWCLPGVPDTWNEILFAQI
ncbi:unnamed protein product [Prunus armeniaca]|uniref:Uncharacterized protein n=1 Tax=Prunus armeniaca TaxID=36596 RepID=A0A6J5Y1W4_PRUAR|nr:unnamed protein product [Prunus armeniaca]